MKLAKYVKFRPERFGGVLFETRSEKVFTLNPTAAALVREIAAGTEPTAIVSRLQAEFDADDPDRIERETTEFTRQLREQGLLVDD